MSDITDLHTKPIWPPAMRKSSASSFACSAISSVSALRSCSPRHRSSSREPISSGNPRFPSRIIVLAIAQMGVHLVFFLHITTGPDNANNVLALAFGLLIVFLVIAGSLWIMANLNHNMMPMDQIMQMQR